MKPRMGFARTSARVAAVAAAALAAAFAGAGSAGGSASGVGFRTAPHRAVQGNMVTFAVAVRPAGTLCSLRVRYSDGSWQGGLGTRRASGGQASWRWQIPRGARPGPARVSVSCGRAGAASRTLMVIGQLIPLKIDVVKSGYSIRPVQYVGTKVSYGVILKNTSKRENAKNVKVLVNFVLADNRLIGTASSTVSQIRSDTEHAVGGEVIFPGAAPIARLEIVVQVGSRSARDRRAPGVSNVRILPDRYDPNWVGSVEGELQNDDRGKTLWYAQLSAVILDAQGNVLGGSGGFAFASLPPGAREFFKVSGSFGAIPFARAASALVSVDPTYQPDGI
jgi:hypothetical protein